MSQVLKKVLCPIENEKTGKTYWMKIGAAYPNRDGSTNIYLDAFPIGRKLQIRDVDENEHKRKDARDQDALPF